jgi:asparaginyl-tRNA synthetase
MLEAEMAFIDNLNGIMDVAEASLKHVLCNQGFRDTLSSPQRVAYLDSLVTEPWMRITYTQAVQRIREALGSESIQWGESISTELERWIAEELGNGLPIFVTDYPTSLKPFYMRPSSEDSQRSTVACFDLLVPRIGELAGGSLREERGDRIEKAIREYNLDPSQYRWYTELRRLVS